MGIDYDQVRVHTRELVKPRLFSSYVKTKPILWILAPGKAELDKLGDPKAAVVWGGKAIGRSTLKMQAGSYEHSFRFQSDVPDSATHVALDGATPVATKFADDLMKRAATRWTDHWAPMKIRKDRLDAASGDLAIGSLLEEAVAMTMNEYLDKHASELWTGTLTEAQQEAELWGTYLGLQHTADGSGTDFYAGKDRSTYSQLRGKEVAASVLTTAGVLATDIVSLKMIRELKTNNTYAGVCNRYASAGKLAVTTPELWNVLANEAEGKHTIFDSGAKVPSVMTSVGMEYPIIQKDTTLITYDPQCPSGELYLLTPDFFCFEVESGNNFDVLPWKKKWEQEEGGGKYIWSQIHAKTRLTCYRPDLQVKVTGLATSA